MTFNIYQSIPLPGDRNERVGHSDTEPQECVSRGAGATERVGARLEHEYSESQLELGAKLLLVAIKDNNPEEFAEKVLGIGFKQQDGVIIPLDEHFFREAMELLHPSDRFKADELLEKAIAYKEERAKHSDLDGHGGVSANPNAQIPTDYDDDWWEF